MMLCIVLREQQKKMPSHHCSSACLYTCSRDFQIFLDTCNDIDSKNMLQNKKMISSEGKIITSAHCWSVCNLGNIGET